MPIQLLENYNNTSNEDEIVIFPLVNTLGSKIQCLATSKENTFSKNYVEMMTVPCHSEGTTGSQKQHNRAASAEGDILGFFNVFQF